MSGYGSKPAPKQFKRASRANLFLRMALIGPSGSGKTYSALLIARGLVGPQGKIALIDTEHESASKYDNLTPFDTCPLDNFAPSDYIEAIELAQSGGYGVLIIDSLSHAWIGKGGALEMVDSIAKRSKSGNSFNAWRDVTPEHNNLVEAILSARMHVIVTMRTKTEYVIEEDPVTHKKVPRKIGTQPKQRDGLEYELDIVGDMDNEQYVVTKTRCSTLAQQVIVRPGTKLGAHLAAWLAEAPAVPAPLPALTQAPAPTPSGPTKALVPVPILDRRQSVMVSSSYRSEVAGAIDGGGENASAAPVSAPQRDEAATPTREPGSDDESGAPITAPFRPPGLPAEQVNALLADIAAQDNREALSVVEGRIAAMKLPPGGDRDVLSKRVMAARRKLGPSRAEFARHLDTLTKVEEVERCKAMAGKLKMMTAWEQTLARVTPVTMTGQDGDGSPLPCDEEDLVPF